MPVAEWDCEGCGVHVTGFGIAEPPKHRFCSVCAWACEFLDPASPEWDAVIGHRTLAPSC